MAKFIKGVSGNPSGKPKINKLLAEVKIYTAEELKKIISKHMRMNVPDLQEIKKSEVATAMEVAIAAALVRSAMTGNLKYISPLLDRTLGKVKEEAEVNINMTLQNLSDAEIIELSKDAIKLLEAK